MTCSVEDHVFTCINDRLTPQSLEAGETKTKSQIIINSLIALVLVLSAGLMSGLTVGLASLDRLSLEVEAQGDPAVKRQADRIFSVIDKHHWMLVTLLLINALSLETLPIFLAKAFTDFEAILFSVIGVLFCGEIIPMSICTGSNQIKIAERMCPIVLGLMYITSPITWPIAKALDVWMGEHKAQRFKNQEL
jgi:CBS domain containing-hemolysin-like protein